ncbi:MAG: hypothetical protein KDA61_14620, partial [Planctomycetales bacterium]|nr:hypothetical protein [Planctomycetales bacterium]
NFVDGVELNGGDAGIDVIGGSSGTFSFASDSSITNPTGVGLNVQNSNAVVAYSGDIANTSGRSVVISGNTGGSVVVSGDVTDTGDGILVENNSGGTYTFTGTTDINSNGTDAALLVRNNTGGNLTVSGSTTIQTAGAQTAVEINNNTVAGTTRLSNLDVTTDSGTGLLATGVVSPATLELTGLNNTFTTATGVAVDMNNVRVGAQNVNIASVTANGGVNAVVLQNITGGSVNIGGSSTTAGDGGVIQAMTGDAIVATNVAGLTLNGLEITNTTGNALNLNHTGTAASTIAFTNSRITTATGSGVLFSNTGSGLTRLTVTDNQISGTTGAGIDLDVNDTAGTTNLVIQDNNVNVTNAEALLLNAAGANAKTINLLAEGNMLTTVGAASVAADIIVDGSASLNATIQGNNEFRNTNPGGVTAFEVETLGSGKVHLNLNGNTAIASNGAVDDYFLTETAGELTVFQLLPPVVAPDESIEDVNNGTFNISAGVTHDATPVPTP